MLCASAPWRESARLASEFGLNQNRSWLTQKDAKNAMTAGGCGVRQAARDFTQRVKG